MRVTDAERRVLEVLWADSPLSAADIDGALAAAGGDWHRKTVNTLISRLVEKGALSVTADTRPKRYAPAIERQAFAKAELSELARGLFGGRVAPLVATLVEAEHISDEDLAALKALVAGLESDAEETTDD
jgi:BlaI family transcriptional regulator, penicillinase repressor